MIMDRETESAVQAAVQAVRRAAEDASNARDLDAMKAALNRVCFANHRALTTINNAENATRRAALAKLGERHVHA